MIRPLTTAALVVLATSLAACQPRAVTCTLKSTRGDSIGYEFVAAGPNLMAEMTASKDGQRYQQDPNQPPLWTLQQTFAPNGQPVVVASSQVDPRYELVTTINGNRTASAHMWFEGQPVGAGHCIAFW
jgi:hypothetical protein